MFAENSEEYIGIGTSTADIARKDVHFIVHFYKTDAHGHCRRFELTLPIAQRIAIGIRR